MIHFRVFILKSPPNAWQGGIFSTVTKLITKLLWPLSLLFATSGEGTGGELWTAESEEGMMGTVFPPSCITGPESTVNADTETKPAATTASQPSKDATRASANHSPAAKTEKRPQQLIKVKAAATTASKSSENATHADTKTVLVPAGQARKKAPPASPTCAATTGENRPPQSMTG